MPAAFPLIAAVAGAGVTSALGGAIGATLLGSTFLATGAAALGGFVVSTAINAIGGSVASKKSKPSLAQANSVQDTIRSTIESHRIIYGQTRVSGVVVFDGATSSGTDNQGNAVAGDNVFRHFVIALAGHEVDEIGSLYIENKAVTLDGSGFVTDAPYSKTQTGETQINATLSSVGAAPGGLLYTTNGAHNFLVGETVFVPISTSKGPEYHGYVIASVPATNTFTVANGPSTSVVEISAASPVYVKRTDSNDIRYIRVKKFLGSDDQAASPDLISEISDWTSDHRLRGIAYIYVRIQQAPEFSMNIQNISAIVKGKKVYDPRTMLTAWSDNAALCIRDYFVSGYGFGCDDDEVNDTYTIAAANICDEDVTLQDSSTQNRYTCNGVLDTASGMFDNLNALLTSCAGTVTYVQGQFRINPAAYDAPAGSITEDMLAGPVSSQNAPSRKDLFNAVRGTFLDPSQDYIVTDFPMVTNETYEAQDGGDQLARDIELPFTNNVEASQRIAKLLLETARQGITVTMSLNHSALLFAVNDTVYVTNTRRGWTNKIFRIKKFGLGVPGPFTVTLQEEASASYDWNSGEATVHDPAPDTTLPDPFIVSAPGVPSLSESLYETRGSGGVKALATISWTASPDRYVRWYVLEYRRIEALAWIVLPQTGDLSVNIEDIAPGIYEFRVKAINHIGAASAYALRTPVEVFGLSAPPSDITGLTIQGMWGQARLSWAFPTDLDVKIGGRILIRHSEATSGATWEDSTTIGNEVIYGNSNGVTLPLKAGTYLAKAQDSSGIQSPNATSVTTKGVSLLAFSDIITVAEETAFAGTHSGTIAADNTLRLAGGMLFDDIADFDALSTLDFPSGVTTSGTYTFATPYSDLGTVQNVRLQSKIELETVNVLDLIDFRQAFMDDWADFDGSAAGGVVDCWVEVSETDDDPAGTPTWSAYNRVDVADYELRAFRCRARITSQDVAFNAFVSTLQVTAKQLV